MPTFFQLTPDAFNSSFQGLSSQKQQKSKLQNQGGRFDNVRRPARGIQIKDDTYAVLEVRTADGTNRPLIDAGGNIVDGDVSHTNKYSNFLIQNIRHQRAEKQQIVETFGEPYVFFFGQHPVMLQVSGVLLNTEDFNWRSEFMQNYDLYLRGTACVRNKARVYLSWDTIVTEGYILDCTTEETSEERYYLKFSFNMFLTNYADISPIGLNEFPRPAEFQLDPTSYDTTGFGIGFGVSRDLSQERLLNAAIFGTNSLVDTVKDLVTNATGFLSGVAQNALSLFSGRSVLVPAGLAPDPLDTQVAFGSVGLLSPLDGRVVQVPPGNDRYAAAIYGPIQKNLDEYVSRLPSWGAGTGPVVSDLFGEQAVEPEDLGNLIQDAVDGLGIKLPTPTDLLTAGRTGKFATVAAFGASATITKKG